MTDRLEFELQADELDLFLQDVDGHLQAMESGILELEQFVDPETVNAVFRAAHTLKAVAGAIGHQRMAELTHSLEALFEAVREGAVSLSPEASDELLATVDVLRALRDEVVQREPCGIDLEPILVRLQALAHTGTTAESAAEQASGKFSRRRGLPPEQASQAETMLQQGFLIVEVRVVADVASFAPAARLLQVAMALAEAGQVLMQRPSEEDLLEDQHEGVLWLLLATQLEVPAVEALVADVSELADFQVQPYLVDEEAAVPVSPAEAPRLSFEGDRVGASEATLARQIHEMDKTVRISVERLDTLMDLVGEMVTDRTRLLQLEETLRARYGKEEPVAALNNTVNHLGQVIDQLQDEVMRTRMLPISQLFDKFPRLVRDVARAAGRQVHLVIEGESTELDRSIIEAIGDPLIHLLRNAVDHGIEAPEARVAAGKLPAGTVWLTAEHVEGQIVLTVRDDGRGVDPEQARQAAVGRGLFTPEDAARLSDDEAISLIFQPGISTAEQVSETSGRGVGLDVVRTNISRIGGSVMIETEVGRGTTFRVTLPLTLAIMQTMLVALGEDVYAIPMTGIIESLYLADVKVNTIKGRPATHWRDEVLPLLHLDEFFYNPYRRALDGPPGKPAIVAVSWGRLQVGLMVDRIIGKQEIVVKPFGPVIGNVTGLSGCAIMGDGRIALIVDVPGLINAVVQAQKQEETR